MWRKNSIAGLRANWPHIHLPGSAHPWIFREIGELIGLKSRDGVCNAISGF